MMSPQNELMYKIDAMQNKESIIKKKSNIKPEPKFYKLKEFAEILKVDLAIIHSWIIDDILKCIRIGGIIRIPESEFERLVNGLESKNK